MVKNTQEKKERKRDIKVLVARWLVKQEKAQKSQASPIKKHEHTSFKIP
jgi:hypothetical protein